MNKIPDNFSETKLKKSIFYKIYLFFRQIWRYVIMLPFALLEIFVERMALTFKSSLSFRIAVTYSVLIIFILTGFSVALYYGITVFFASPLGNIEITKAELKELVIWVVGAGFFISLAIISLGKKLSDKLISPVRKMAEDVKKISSKNMSLRLDENKAKDELKDLANYFNSMMDEIEISYNKKNQFVSDASHELRTPISVILGYANMLERWGKTDPSILDESIAVLISESKNMQNLVEKLLFLARSDKGTLKIDKTEVDLIEIAEEVFKETEIIVTDRKFEFIKKIKKAKISANYDMIKQLIRIFMDNAIKFTDTGGKIKLEILGSEKEITFRIVDDGIGISQSDLPKIFDRFYRADKARSSDRGGTGLGLSIAKLIIVSHEAKVHINSDEGLGTTVNITFKSLNI